MKTADLLSHIEFFKEMTSKDLGFLADHTEQKPFVKNEIIFNAGDKGHDLYMIKSGRVEIYIPQPKDGKKLVLAVLTAGQFFGELSLFDKKPRSATARAIEPSDILILKQDTVLAYLQEQPRAAVAILTEMSDRLRQTNERLNRQMSRDVNEEFEKKLTLANRIADKVASFGGSWKFILVFLGFILGWMILNVTQWIITPFDHYPYQFLNLVLAVISSMQAPIIMMSQNRQSEKDRLSAKIDFEVNLKNEVGIETALQKIEAMGKSLAAIERTVMKKTDHDPRR